MNQATKRKSDAFHAFGGHNAQFYIKWSKKHAYKFGFHNIENSTDVIRGLGSHLLSAV